MINEHMTLPFSSIQDVPTPPAYPRDFIIQNSCYLSSARTSASEPV